MVEIILSSKEQANKIINHFLFYVSPPLFILISSYFLHLSGKISPLVMDEYLMAIDGTLGIYPSLIVGRFIRALPSGINDILNISYAALPLAFIVVYIRRKFLEKKPPYNLLIEFIIIGMVGFSLYNIIPGCGSRFAFAATWPDTLPPKFLQESPQLMQCAIANPRNCLPSLHTAWIICLLRYAWLSDFLTKSLILILALCTLVGVFGVGAHYLVDLVVGLAFANCIGGLFASQLPWSNTARWQAAILGILLCLSWYTLILHGLSVLQSSKILSWFVFLTSIFVSAGLEWALFKELSRNTSTVERSPSNQLVGNIDDF